VKLKVLWIRNRYEWNKNEKCLHTPARVKIYHHSQGWTNPVTFYEPSKMFRDQAKKLLKPVNFTGILHLDLFSS
jgi:hypothetical protein